MNEEMIEKLAQLQYENAKLLDELNHLKEHTFSVEEILNIKCTELSEEKRKIKSLELQNNSLAQVIKDKDFLIDSFEHEKKNFKQLHTKLSSENLSLKGELLQEKLKNRQMEILKTKEEEWKNAYANIKKENQKLVFELSLKSEECLSNAAAIKEFLLQIKELENEKAELMAMRDTLLIREKEERLKTSENFERLLRKSPEWSKSQMNLFAQGDQDLSFNKDVNNLREEILEVELREKQKKIGQLESLLHKKEEKELEREKSIAELKKELSNAGLLNYDSRVDLRLDSSALYNIYSHLLEIINWPEGQSGECKPLTEVATLSVVVKDGVQTTQPSSVKIIETISIASQTDPIKNLSPVLPFKAFEKLQANLDLNQSRSDSDDEGEGPLPFIEKDKMQKSLQLFSEPKNCDLDMDMYRSCRKLSVLPEEDVDEFLHRKTSLKKSYKFNLNSSDSKTHSADDITKVKTFRSSLKTTYSCSNMISKNCKLMEVSGLCDGSNSSHSDNVKKTDLKLDCKKDNELQLPIMSPKDAFRQPHSFDSYLDPLKTPNSPLPRQISDPTQNTVFAPPVTRRGSYIKKPKSTCRPLTLPCDEGSRKKEERICKVRFDLAEITPEDDVKSERKNNLSSSYNNSKKIKMVSRFTVEIIDEVKFRKSVEANTRNTAAARKRPPLIHSVVYKKSVLRNLTNFPGKNLTVSSDVPEMNSFLDSPDSPVYDTATEESPMESFDAENLENKCLTNDSHSLKRKREPDLSSYSFEDSQDSSEGSDILIKSIKLHTNSECIVMKELKKENSDSSFSNPDSDIPYVDAEDLPVVKQGSDVIKICPVPDIFFSENPTSSRMVSPGSLSEGSDTYLTPCDETPVSENHEESTFGQPKSAGLSKSPTVLKNLANFELLATISDCRKLKQSEIIEEEEKEDFEEKKTSDKIPLKAENSCLKRTSSDVSETSESDTLTYGTVKSHLAASSDCDSDTYVTVWSDKSFGWERKFSDLSENSSSPYNTPPDTSSASFCTPPDTYSPILNSVRNHSNTMLDKSYKSLDNTYAERKREEFSDNFCGTSDPSGSSPLFYNTCELGSENNEFFYPHGTDSLKSEKRKTSVKNYDVIFDSPKLEFYETNDSVENLQAFLQTEEDLTEGDSETRRKNERPDEIKSLSDPMLFETEEFGEVSSKRNSLESPKLLEKRTKKHPILSRQNSTEEYHFLDPHDSCLNLSEEISSPSTTPDTSNKTVIFKNVPLTVSNTIDLDDDFPISEAEIQVNLNGSQAEILEVRLKEEPVARYLNAGHCLSEPCTPSISSADFLEFSIPRKQRSSFTEESLMCGKLEANLPEIIVSHLSSESENSDSEMPAYAETDFASNISDRSEVHLSDVTSVSGYSENSGSFSEHSDNVVLDVFSSDSDKSDGVSPEIFRDSSSSSATNKTSPVENSVQDFAQKELPPRPDVLYDDDFHSSNEMGVDVRDPRLESGEVSSCAEDMP